MAYTLISSKCPRAARAGSTGTRKFSRPSPTLDRPTVSGPQTHSPRPITLPAPTPTTTSIPRPRVTSVVPTATSGEILMTRTRTTKMKKRRMMTRTWLVTSIQTDSRGDTTNDLVIESPLKNYLYPSTGRKLQRAAASTVTWRRRANTNRFPSNGVHQRRPFQVQHTR